MKGHEIFGRFFKEKRRALGLSLREFCRKHNVDAGNLSKIERGIWTPEGRETLEKYARMLDIREGSDDWLTFFDLAAASRGRIPDEMLENEQVVRALPLMFRTLRKEKVSEEDLAKLIDIVSGAWRHERTKV